MIISNKYKLIKKVGSGAFGEIYKGRSSFKWHNNITWIQKLTSFFMISFMIFNVFLLGTNLEDGSEIAVKLEPIKTKFP